MSHTPRSAYTAATAGQHDQQDEHSQPIGPVVVDVPPDDGEQQCTKEETVRLDAGRGSVGGVDQVIDAPIDGALQFGASGRGVRRGPISQVHVLFDQPLDSSGL